MDCIAAQNCFLVLVLERIREQIDFFQGSMREKCREHEKK